MKNKKTISILFFLMLYLSLTICGFAQNTEDSKSKNGKHEAAGVVDKSMTAETDLRLTKNIKTINNALEKINELTGVYFDWRWDEYAQIEKYKNQPYGVGVIAQNVEQVFPQAVSKNTEGFRSVDYGVLVGPLVEAVKELLTFNEKVIVELQQARSENAEIKIKLEDLIVTMRQFEEILLKPDLSSEDFDLKSVQNEIKKIVDKDGRTKKKQ